MTTVVSPPFSQHDQHQLQKHLRSGGVLAFPTETFYGLGGQALSRQAVEQVFALKRRPVEKALLVLALPEQWEALVEVPPEAQALMDRFWPGPLTLVLRARPEVPDFLRGPGNTLAIRHSPHPVVQELLRLGEGPLIGTSANLSAHPSCTSAAAVQEQLGEALEVLVDGGATAGGLPSTLLDGTQTPPRVLRAGVLSAAELGLQ